MSWVSSWRLSLACLLHDSVNIRQRVVISAIKYERIKPKNDRWEYSQPHNIKILTSSVLTVQQHRIQALSRSLAKKDHPDSPEDDIEFKNKGKILDIKKIILELFKSVFL